MNFEDKYFVLREASNLGSIPKKVLKQVYNVRTKADWENQAINSK